LVLSGINVLARVGTAEILQSAQSHSECHALAP